jgi:hypothetical protein
VASLTTPAEQRVQSAAQIASRSTSEGRDAEAAARAMPSEANNSGSAETFTTNNISEITEMTIFQQKYETRFNERNRGV